jgi:hypothetical protein
VAMDFTAYWQSFRTRVERLLRSDPVYFHNWSTVVCTIKMWALSWSAMGDIEFPVFVFYFLGESFLDCTVMYWDLRLLHFNWGSWKNYSGVWYIFQLGCVQHNCQSFHITWFTGTYPVGLLFHVYITGCRKIRGVHTLILSHGKEICAVLPFWENLQYSSHT